MDIRRLTASNENLQALVKSNVAELHAAGYDVMLFSRPMPTGEVDAILVPYRGDDPPERINALGDEMARLIAAGFQMIGVDDLTLARVRKAPIDPSAVQFS